MLKKNILLVDDDPDDVELFTMALNETEPDTVYYIADDGDRALEMLRVEMSQLPDLIFLDLNMPRMNGVECLAELKKDERLKNIPVIICTTSNNEKDKETTLKMGAAYFLTKPLSFKKFREEIAFVLQNIGVNHI